jgi:hypothetical protein
MKTDINTIDTTLSALGVSLPVGLLARLEIEEYLDQLDNILALAIGERQRLGELLRAAERITARQLDEALAEQRQGSRKLGEILIDKGWLTQNEKDVVLEFQRRQMGEPPVSGKFDLGNILVANGQITRSQLEDALLRQVTSGRCIGEELITAGHVSKNQVEDGLLLQHKLVTYALCVTLGLLPLVSVVPSAEAAQRIATMSVSVTVIAKAKLLSDYQATTLTITADDVVRGYVDAPAGSRFSVTTNSRSGYFIEFHPVGYLFQSVHVGGLGNAVQLGSDGGTIVQRGPLPPNITHELNYRFILHPDVQPGSFPWPLQLSVLAI